MQDVLNRLTWTGLAPAPATQRTPPIVFLVRDGEHNPLLNDPEGTVRGSDVMEQAFKAATRTGHIKVFSSPLRRAINCAFGLFAASWNITPPRIRLRLLPDATEVVTAPADVGSRRTLLVQQYPRVDAGDLAEDWYAQREVRRDAMEDLVNRAIRVRRFLREQDAEVVVLFTHSVFLKYLTGDGAEATDWAPHEYRKYYFSTTEAASYEARIFEDPACALRRWLPDVAARIDQIAQIEHQRMMAGVPTLV